MKHPPHQISWCLRRPFDEPQPLEVTFTSDGRLKIRMEDAAFMMRRRDARMLAKRINQALDYYKSYKQPKESQR